MEQRQRLWSAQGAATRRPPPARHDSGPRERGGQAESEPRQRRRAGREPGLLNAHHIRGEALGRGGKRTVRPWQRAAAPAPGPTSSSSSELCGTAPASLSPPPAAPPTRPPGRWGTCGSPARARRDDGGEQGAGGTCGTRCSALHGPPGGTFNHLSTHLAWNSWLQGRTRRSCRASKSLKHTTHLGEGGRSQSQAPLTPHETPTPPAPPGSLTGSARTGGSRG